MTITSTFLLHSEIRIAFNSFSLLCLLPSGFWRDIFYQCDPLDGHNPKQVAEEEKEEEKEEVLEEKEEPRREISFSP